jgi:hypothetical protein
MVTCERCEEILKGENFDVEPWTCPVCSAQGARAHWVASHILTTLRGLPCPERARPYQRDTAAELARQGERAIDVD